MVFSLLPRISITVIGNAEENISAHTVQERANRFKKIRRSKHFNKTQILSFRFFCRFRQGVWHSVRGSQGVKLLLKIRIRLIVKPSRSNRPARLFRVLKSFS